jgi:16S rRNA processing protein RimM
VPHTVAYGAPGAPDERSEQRRLVCLGVVAGAHGLAGEVWIRSFTARPEDIAAYGPLVDAGGGRTLRLHLTGRGRPGLSARIDGIGDRTAAEALKGLRLCVPRSALPAPREDEFYHVDLIGLRVEVADAGRAAVARPWGRVTAVHDFGAGTVLEIAGGDHPAGAGDGTLLVPFTRAAVPEVDLGAGRLVIAASWGTSRAWEACDRDPGAVAARDVA